MITYKTYFDENNLLNLNLSGVRLMIFSGCSGSGKSTSIDFLLKNNTEFINRAVSYIGKTGPVDWEQYGNLGGLEEVVVIDELMHLSDFRRIFMLLLRGHVVIAANHMPRIYFKWLEFFWTVRHFVTDRKMEKIEHYLDYLRLQYTTIAVRDYCKQFGVSFTTVDIILERYPHKKFDVAYDRFQKFCRHKTAMRNA
jgi:hypothetical protein